MMVLVAAAHASLTQTVHPPDEVMQAAHLQPGSFDVTFYSPGISVVDVKATGIRGVDYCMVRAEDGGGDGVRCDRLSFGSHERYLQLVLSNGKSAFRTHDGHYLRAAGGGGGDFDAAGTVVGGWESFTLQPHGYRKALRTHDGHYVVAENAGWSEMNATRNSAIGDWEKFRLVNLKNADSIRFGWGVSEGGGSKHFKGGFASSMWILGCDVFPGRDECAPHNGARYSEAGAHADAWAEMFDKRRTMAELDVIAGSRDGAGSQFSVNVQALGTTVYSASLGEVDIPAIGASFDKDKSFGVHGVSVKIRAEAAVVMGLTVDADVSIIDPGITMHTTPYATIAAGIGASVNVACAGASAGGDLDVVDLRFPVSTTVTMDEDFRPDSIEVEGDVEFTMLDGELWYEVDYCVGDTHKTLADFTAYNQTFNLVDVSWDL